MAKDSFVFHLENREDLEDLSTEQIGEIFLAMIQYAEDGQEPAFDDPLLRTAWKPIRRRLRFDLDSYERQSKANKENGLKGGAPKGNKNAVKQPKTTENNRKQAKTTLSDTDTDSDTDTVSNISFFTADAAEEKEKNESEPFMTADVNDRFEKFKLMRAEKGKAMNADSEKIIKDKIVRFSKSDPVLAAKIIDQAIEGGYMTVIPYQQPPEAKTSTKSGPGFAQHDYDFDDLRRRAKA